MSDIKAKISPEGKSVKASLNFTQNRDSVDWNNISNKPVSYNPSAHNHNDLYYGKSEVDGKLAGLTKSILIGNVAETPTSGDVLGNSLYLPSQIIYQDVSGIKNYWTIEIGGNLYYLSGGKYDLTNNVYDGIFTGYRGSDFVTWRLRINSSKQVKTLYPASEAGSYFRIVANDDYCYSKAQSDDKYSAYPKYSTNHAEDWNDENTSIEDWDGNIMDNLIIEGIVWDELVDYISNGGKIILLDGVPCYVSLYDKVYMDSISVIVNFSNFEYLGTHVVRFVMYMPDDTVEPSDVECYMFDFCARFDPSIIPYPLANVQIENIWNNN